MRDVEVDTNHQAATTHVLDMRLCLLEFLQLCNKVFACFVGIFDDVFLFEHIEHGEGCSASQMVAAERCAQLSVDGLEVGRDEYGAHGETVSDSFRNGNDVRLDAEPLVGEELTATSVAALYFVANQRYTEAFAGVCQVLGELWCSHLDATDTLNTLQDDGSDASTRHLAHPRLNVV